MRQGITAKEFIAIDGKKRIKEKPTGPKGYHFNELTNESTYILPEDHHGRGWNHA